MRHGLPRAARACQRECPAEGPKGGQPPALRAPPRSLRAR
ncbi:hypothetical protein CSE45_3609 [Citreicella sp. SE45]|nr:hypothetical protein CSE45_3609 [Citreicella sp. SE45]